MSIQVEGFQCPEEVALGQTFTNLTPFTVNNDGWKRQLAPDVLADGFIEESKVPPVTVKAVRDSQGQEWSASITIGHQVSEYTNWCGETFPIVFE